MLKNNLNKLEAPEHYVGKNCCRKSRYGYSS